MKSMEFDGVHIFSTQFKTEPCCDYVMIDGERYDGDDHVNQHVPNEFLITFHTDGRDTDKGFVLKWCCDGQFTAITTTTTTTTTTTSTTSTTTTTTTTTTDIPTTYTEFVGAMEVPNYSDYGYSSSNGSNFYIM